MTSNWVKIEQKRKILKHELNDYEENNPLDSVFTHMRRRKEQKEFNAIHNISIPEADLVGFINRFDSNSSRRYAGTLPLETTSQCSGVCLQASHLWHAHSYVRPKSLPSFQQLVEKEKKQNR